MTTFTEYAKHIKDEDKARPVPDRIFNLAPLVKYDGVPGEPVPDPLEGFSAVPGGQKMGFTVEDYIAKAEGMERDAITKHFSVDDIKSLKLREPTPHEQATTKLSSAVFFLLQKAAWYRAYAAQLQKTQKLAVVDVVEDTAAKRRRIAAKQLRAIDEDIKRRERWLKISKKDIAEAERVKELIEIADTAKRYELELEELRVKRAHTEAESKR
jgi:hypothetical protein